MSLLDLLKSKSFGKKFFLGVAVELTLRNTQFCADSGVNTLTLPPVSKPGDELLAVISARRTLTWKAFKDCFDVLHTRAIKSNDGIDDPLNFLRLRSLRLLSDLGHAEPLPFGDSSAIAAAPSVLARLPAPGLARAILCGSRDFRTAVTLRMACAPFGMDARVIGLNHPYTGGYAPSAVAVDAIDDEVLSSVCSKAGVEFIRHPPAWTFLDQSASIADYEHSLTWTSDSDPSWPRRDFSIHDLHYEFAQPDHRPRLSSFKDPITHREIIRFWRGDQVATVDRDWGRWLLLRESAVAVIHFDPVAQMVGIPSTVPLPRLLSRGLALFSGRAPFRKGNPQDSPHAIDWYGSVPAEAATYLAEKLGQLPLPHAFNQEFDDA